MDEYLEEEDARTDGWSDHRPASHKEVARVVADHVVHRQSEPPGGDGGCHCDHHHDHQQHCPHCPVLRTWLRIPKRRQCTQRTSGRAGSFLACHRD